MRYKVILAWPDSPADELLCRSMQEVRDWAKIAKNHPTVRLTVVDLITNQIINPPW